MNTATPRPVRFLSGNAAEHLQSRRDANAVSVSALALAWEEECLRAVSAELQTAANSILAIAADWQPGRTCRD
jgi:hypothetical protein